MTTTACPRCNAALTAGAQFCGSCGAPVGAAPTPPPPPIPHPPPYQPPPPMPNVPQMARGFSGGGGGASQQATFNGEPGDAYSQAISAINAMGGQVLWQQPPTSAKFFLPKKDTWTTGGFTMKYDGDLQVQRSSPSQTTARVSLKLQWGSFLPLALTTLAFVFVMGMFNLYFAVYGLFIMAILVAYSAWQMSSQLPDKVLAQFFQTLSGAPAAPQANTFRPQPQPAPPTAPVPTSAPAPAPAPAPAGGDAAAIMEQIKQLGALRDAGVLTADEFEAKKAELLKRI
ncbi:MAG: SHOCT domain-containing protein [Hyphomonadaceae bacterium]